MTETRTPHSEQPESIEIKHGRNTEVHFTFVRHSQKTSGAIYTEDGSELVQPDLSESGIRRAAIYGQKTLTDRKITKAYATETNRTRQTLEAALRAAQVDTIILQTGEETAAFFALPFTETSPKYRKRQEKIMKPRRDKYMTNYFPGKKFEELDPDEQELVAEFAEEPAFEEYLSHDNKRPDKDTPSPREVAATVAFKINRLINLPDFMSSNKSIDLVSTGHKTSTESFLKYALKRNVDGRQVTGFDNLAKIGGSLKILDGWDLQIKNDEKGEKSVVIILRRENGETTQYGLDIEIVKKLAKEYITKNGLKPLKIDAL